MTKKKIAIISLLGLLLIIGVRATISFDRLSYVERHFASIKAGDTRESVTSSFGRPNYHAGPCSSASWAFPKGCASEYVYSHPFAPLLSDYYVVWFSSDDRVIDAEHLSSP
jgi:hypothetical protein